MKRSPNAEAQALRIQGRRRMMGAAVIMISVILLLPMLLNQSKGPKLNAGAPVGPAAPPALPATQLRPEGAQPAPDLTSQSVPSAAMPDPSEADVVEPATEAKGKLLVQVGVFSDQGKAQALAKKLNDRGIHAFVEAAHYKVGDRFRVRIGPMDSKAEVQSLMQALDRLGLKSLVVAP